MYNADTMPIQRRSPRRYVYTSPYTDIRLIANAISHTSKGMRNISHPEGIYRCYAQDCVRSLRSSDSSRTKRQVNAFILCRDTFIPLTFSPILALESRLKQLPMPQHGVSECGIGCKGNEKNDYSRIFSWLFCVVRIKTDIWAHKEDLLRTNTPFS